MLCIYIVSVCVLCVFAIFHPSTSCTSSLPSPLLFRSFLLLLLLTLCPLPLPSCLHLSSFHPFSSFSPSPLLSLSLSSPSPSPSPLPFTLLCHPPPLVHTTHHMHILYIEPDDGTDCAKGIGNSLHCKQQGLKQNGQWRDIPKMHCNMIEACIVCLRCQL